jgi:glycoprotein endo-alpha-1,2-mannosidase
VIYTSTIVTLKSKALALACILLASIIQSCGSDNGEVKDPPVHEVKQVVKTNPMQVYMHYMTWFQGKSVSGYWGSHWRMANKNPDVIVDETTGKRQIASHYYPLIGPYDSKDPDVVEYHLLLMKYAGVDAVLIDWYGSHTLNDYRLNLLGTNALIDKTDDVGMKFSVVYEEYTAGKVEESTSKTAIQAAQADMLYLKQNYFSKEEYLEINDVPVLLTFGPRFFQQPSQWSEIFSVLGTKPKFLPLWNHGGLTGETDNGEFSWVDFNASLSELNSFYNKGPHVEILIGSAYPRFHDFYEEGGWGDSYGYVADNAGATLQATLNKATERNANYLQLVTWNDFGEGTVIEPTLEDEFSSLQAIQEFTGVSYGLEELELIHTYYLRKKELKGNAEAAVTLEKIFKCLSELEVDEAKQLMEQLN